MSDTAPEMIEVPLRENSSGQFEYTLPAALMNALEIEDAVEYRVNPRWTDSGRDTTIALDIGPADQKATNTRSVVIHSSDKGTVRLPHFFAEERGLDRRLQDGDEVTVFVFNEGDHYQLVFDEPFETIEDLDPIDNVVSKTGFSTKQDGPDRQYTGYWLVIPTEFNRHYNLETSGYGKWSLAVVDDQIALVLEFVGGEAGEHRGDATFTRWNAYDAGDVDGEEQYLTSQVQMMVPRVLVEALGWAQQNIQLIPEEDRIVITPDQKGTRRDDIENTS